MSNIVMYHGACYDGFGAAWTARMWFRMRDVPDDQVTFFPMTYGPARRMITDNNDILMLDFSLPRQEMIDLAARSKSMLVLDHHKTAQANCEGLDFCRFDMTRSGAGMTWDHCFPTLNRLPLIDYVEDRDLWNWKLPKSEEVHEWLASYPMDFEVWDGLSQRLFEDFPGVVKEGETILRYVEQKVKEVCKHARLTELAGYTIPVVNCPYIMGSDCAHRLLDIYPDAPFAAYYLDRGDGQQQWGLRGRDTDDFDVSTIAAQFGGGGHKKAAGFERFLSLPSCEERHP